MNVTNTYSMRDMAVEARCMLEFFDQYHEREALYANVD